MAKQRLTDMESRPDDGEKSARWVKVVEAAKILGVSKSTVRRRVQAGEFQEFRISRPQGTVAFVLLPASFDRRPAEVSADTSSISTIEHRSPVDSPRASALQEALATLESLLFTGLDSDSLLWLRARVDDLPRVIDHLLAARRLVEGPKMPDALSR